MKKILLVLSILFIMVGCSNKGVPAGDPANPNIIAGVREDEKYNDFNVWLFNEMSLQYTPTFIFVDEDNKVRYFNDGEITLEDFDSILKNIKNNSVTLDEDYKTANLGKEFFDADFIEKGEMNVVEIVWTNCGHCEVQIDENNPTIFAAHPEINFVEYFPLDVQADVDEFIK